MCKFPPAPHFFPGNQALIILRISLHLAIGALVVVDLCLPLNIRHRILTAILLNVIKQFARMVCDLRVHDLVAVEVGVVAHAEAEFVVEF